MFDPTTNTQEQITEIRLSLTRIHGDLDKLFYNSRKHAEDIEIIQDQIDKIEQRIDQKFHWIIRLLGSTLVAVILNLAWLIVTDSHIKVVTKDESVKTQQQ